MARIDELMCVDMVPPTLLRFAIQQNYGRAQAGFPPPFNLIQNRSFASLDIDITMVGRRTGVTALPVRRSLWQPRRRIELLFQACLPVP